ncbi:MAG: MFS transporter [Desulfobacterales bacterium]|nr:MFS transporter [Desulfobacterales bacterium]
MTDPDRSDGYLVSKRYAHYVFALLFLIYMFDYIDRLVVVSLFPFLQQEWNLTDTQCGMLVSAVYWSILIFTLPVSVLVDRWSRKKSIGLMAGLWCLATAACAFTKSFPQLFAARTAIGIGEAGYAPGGTAMIAAIYPEKKRAAVMGIWNASIPLGSALGIALGGFIAQTWGWRHAFGIVALPGLIVAVLFFFVKDYKTVDLRRTDASGKTRRASYGEIIKGFARTPSLILTYLGFAGNVFVTTALLSWLPTFFHRVEGLPMAQAGTKGSAVMLLSMIGAPLGGFLADKWQKKRGNARPLICALTSTLTAVTLLLTFGLFKGGVQYATLLVVGVSAAAFVPAAAAITQDVVHPGVRATSYSFCVIVQHLLGSSMGPLFVGYISDRTNISTALAILPVFALVAALLFLAAAFFYEKDLARVEKIDVSLEK